MMSTLCADISVDQCLYVNANIETVQTLNSMLCSSAVIQQKFVSLKFSQEITKDLILLTDLFFSSIGVVQSVTYWGCWQTGVRKREHLLRGNNVFVNCCPQVP